VKHRNKLSFSLNNVTIILATFILTTCNVDETHVFEDFLFFLEYCRSLFTAVWGKIGWKFCNSIDFEHVSLVSSEFLRRNRDGEDDLRVGGSWLEAGMVPCQPTGGGLWRQI
jgi:hypothetical protein